MSSVWLSRTLHHLIMSEADASGKPVMDGAALGGNREHSILSV